jgi:AcrR family transcriptional regulator
MPLCEAAAAGPLSREHRAGYLHINLYVGNMRFAMQQPGAQQRIAAPARRPRRARLSRPERERQMLAAAHHLFAERGYAAVTMDDVAGAAGITKPLLYNYFGNKERLYLACMTPAGEALTETIVTAIAHTADAGEALDAGLRAFFEFLAADRAAWRVLFDETLPAGGEIARRVAEQRERLSGLVERALLEQLPASARARARNEVQALSSAVLGAAEALGRWWLRSDAIPAQDAAQMLIDTLAPGLRARVARHPAAPARRAA